MFVLTFLPTNLSPEHMNLCSQSFLPYIASTGLIHEMAERIRGRQTAAETNSTEEATERPALTGPEGEEVLEQFYLPTHEWVMDHTELRDMLDSRKAVCQRLRQRQLRKNQADYQKKFALAVTKSSKLVLDQSLPLPAEPPRSLLGKFDWVEWDGTNANPDVQLRYRRALPSHKPRLKVGILLGVANAEEVVRKYQPFLNLWKCYAHYHQMEFLMPTDDYNLRAHFRAANWFRWYMADQFLEHYDWLILVDPDQYIVPECWGPDRFSFLDDLLVKTNKHVIMRDIFPPQTLNNGLTMLRNSPQGRAFLDLLLDKISWIQTFQHDQGAFDETVLEVVGIVERGGGEEKSRSSAGSGGVSRSSAGSGGEDDQDFRERTVQLAAEKAERQQTDGVEKNPMHLSAEEFFNSADDDFYDSICMPWLFPDVNGAHQIAA